MRPHFSLRATLAAMTVGCVAVAGYAYFNRSPVLKLFGASGLELVKNPSRVEAYRLGELPSRVSADDATPFEYPITAGPVRMTSSFQKEVSKALRSEATYGWDYAKACGPPIYGARLSFVGNNDQIDVYLCFQCNYLAVCRNGEVYGGEDFDNARPVLLRAVKSAFPDDSAIQGLRDN